MIDLAYLKSIGFSGFMFLLPEQRDNKERLTWNHWVATGEAVWIRLINLNGKWQMDLLIATGRKAEKIVQEQLNGKSLEKIIEFVKFHVTDTLFQKV